MATQLCRPAGALNYRNACPHRLHGGLRCAVPPGLGKRHLDCVEVAWAFIAAIFPTGDPRAIHGLPLGSFMFLSPQFQFPNALPGVYNAGCLKIQD